MELIKSLWSTFKAEPVPTLHRWADMRQVWLVMAGASGFMMLCSTIYFQGWLAMDPCEKCVYIRLSQICIIIAGLFLAISPKNLAVKLLGLALAWWAIFYGLNHSLDYIASHHTMDALDSGMDFFAAGGGANACATEPAYPFALALHEWWPGMFAITGVCGEDDWSFLGGTMGHWLVFTYSIKIAVLGTVTAGWASGAAKLRSAAKA
ncbi:disulfide bond formation protein B [Ferrimonas pelagia]|uniref:Putative protein-disulfide oxidoreductase DsbI n=1 Tax=Ferrimonas pelagia TaxID=1177826 RepID=A0ABP9EFF2_9GAMM